MSHLEENNMASNGNAIVRRGPSRNWEGRAARFGVVAICLLLAFVGIAVARVFYGSNILNGHVTIDEKLGISGTLPNTYTVGVTQVSTISVASYTDSTLSAYLVLVIHRPDNTTVVTIAGNLVQPVCNDWCTWTGLPFALPARGIVPVDIGVTFGYAGQIDWTIQAWAA